MEAAKGDEDALGSVRIGDPVRASRVGDVDLDDDEVRQIVGVDRRHVLVHDHGLVVRPQRGGQRGEAEGREEGVFNRTPVRAGGLGERRQDELHPQRAARVR